MTIFDYIVLGIISISILLSIIRGFVRESLSLAGWIAAFLIAKSYAVDFEPMLPTGLGGESIRVLIAFVVLFLSVLLIAALMTMLLSAVIKSIGLGFVDRFLGAFFGFVRGLLVVTLLVIMAGLTALPQQPLWQEAFLRKPIESVAMEVRSWLPKDLARRISFEKDEN